MVDQNSGPKQGMQAEKDSSILPPIIEDLISEAKDHTIKKIKISQITGIPKSVSDAIPDSAG